MNLETSTRDEKFSHVIGECSRTIRYRDDEQRWGTTEYSHECEYTGKNFEMPILAVFQKALEGFSSIVIDFDVLGGTPRIAGTRIPVSMILDAVQYYGDLRGALRSYPELTMEQVKEALSFAGVVLEQSVEHEFETTAG
ncbi:MAG: DUF433 domain-containing protein [Acidobacteriaceae bacterium]